MSKKKQGVPDQAKRFPPLTYCSLRRVEERAAAVIELRRVGDKLEAGVVERAAICELLSPTPRVEGAKSHHVLQEWYTAVYRDPEQKALASDLKEMLQKLGTLVRQTSSSGNDPIWKRPSTEEIKELGRRLGVLAERIAASLPAVGEAVRKSSDLSAEERALATLVAHPDWSDAEIARHVPCSRGSLYRWSKYRLARETLQTGRQELPRADEF
ncbi:MAG: hypothetical protein GXX96_18455 [Planctomycetaceae bacterium]|nr:hypothetical protein [Planctomycetaceae bacterium]